VLVGLAVAPAAAAHGGGSQHGYVSTVERTAGPRGIEAEASGDGHFSFTAPPGRTVIVRGYEDEPYLRFQSGSVYENQRSPTPYVNRDRRPPATARAAAQPRWKLVSRGQTYTWDDHRTHWTAANPPAAVDRDPDARHHISNWKIAGTVDGAPFMIHGSLDWAPTKRGLGRQWLLVPILAGLAIYALFVTFMPRPRAARASSSA
jgi:hypothetical protein